MNKIKNRVYLSVQEPMFKLAAKKVRGVGVNKKDYVTVYFSWGAFNLMGETYCFIDLRAVGNKYFIDIQKSAVRTNHNLTWHQDTRSRTSLSIKVFDSGASRDLFNYICALDENPLVTRYSFSDGKLTIIFDPKELEHQVKESEEPMNEINFKTRDEEVKGALREKRGREGRGDNSGITPEWNVIDAIAASSGMPDLRARLTKAKEEADVKLKKLEQAEAFFSQGQALINEVYKGG